MKWKILLTEIFAAAVILCGCYDSTETENRKYVVLMGLDGGGKAGTIGEDKTLIGEGGEYILSAGEAELGSDIGQDSEKQKTILVTGNTLPEMRQSADLYSSKKMYFGQLKAVILGDEVYSQSRLLADTVCTMERMNDINTKIVVFASDTAFETVDTVMSKGSKGGLYLWDYYKNNGGETDLNEYMNFEDLIKSMRQEEVFIIPKISVDGEEVFLDGGIVIKADEYMGDITTEDIRGMKWIEGKAVGETVTCGNISARVKRQDVKIDAQNGKISIYVRADIALESGYDTDRDATERAFEAALEKNLTDTVNRSITLNADFLSLTDDGNTAGLIFEVSSDVNIIAAGVIK